MARGAAAAETANELDGRRLRREQNRQAVVEALVELYREGRLDPSAAEVAERAGLSPRSLFRYFDDADDLNRTAVRHLQAIARPLLAVEPGPEAPLATRVEALVASRLRLWTTVAPAARVSRLRSPSSPLLAAELANGRRFLRRQLAELFAPELARRPWALAALDVLCSFESVELLLHDQRLSRQRTAATLEASILALLTETEGRR